MVLLPLHENDFATVDRGSVAAKIHRWSVPSALLISKAGRSYFLLHSLHHQILHGRGILRCNIKHTVDPNEGYLGPQDTDVIGSDFEDSYALASTILECINNSADLP